MARLQQERYIQDSTLTEMWEKVTKEVLAMFKKISFDDILDQDIHQDFYKLLQNRLNLLQRVFYEENAFQQVKICFRTLKHKT